MWKRVQAYVAIAPIGMALQPQPRLATVPFTCAYLSLLSGTMISQRGNTYVNAITWPRTPTYIGHM